MRDGADLAVKGILEAAERVKKLRLHTDPGHVSMIRFLDRLENRLRDQANALKISIDRESGSQS